MNLIFKKTEEILKNAGIEEYKAEAKMIILEKSNSTMEEIILKTEIPNEEDIIATAQKRAATKLPIQYILGCCYFMNEKYKVNKNVLIPRDETELLVEKAYELIKNKKNKIDILDIGTGSGCISCALAKKLEQTEILAVDISTDALEVAIENIGNLNLIRKVIIRKSDIYSKIRNCEKFDLIVSNPPYIPKSNQNDIDKTEVKYEPKEALYADDENGIEFYEKIIEGAKKYLKKDGFVAFELGINQSVLVRELFIKNEFKNIVITKDLAGIDRVITAQNLT